MKILFPTACSGQELEIVKSAFIIVDKLNGELTVLSVVNAPIDAVYDKSGRLIEDEEFDMDLFRRQMLTAEEELEEWVKKAGINAKMEVKAGLQNETILNTLKSESFDLVILTNLDLHSQDGALQTTKAENIVLNAEVPVLSLKKPLNGIRSIALANNFRRENVPVGFVKTLQEAFGATLRLVRVNTPRKFMSEHEVRANMEKFVANHNLKNVEYHIIEGKSITERLNSFCEDLGVDILAIGSKQRKGFSSFIHGCPSREAVNEMSVPVLTFKSKIK